VLDPFCGCGTAIAVAEQWKRRWIGIDVNPLAINIVRARLTDAVFEVRGEPVDIEGATQLASDAPFRFQWWILGRIGARPANGRQKKGADSGIDGELFFRDSPSGPAKRALVSVKAGDLQPAHVRELVGVVKREEAPIGVLLTLSAPTRAMQVEAAKAGFFESHRGRHPKIQIVTAEQVLRGQGVDMPGDCVAGLKKARRAPPSREQLRIPGLASARAPAAASDRRKA
jgi:hypothetical protein